MRRFFNSLIRFLAPAVIPVLLLLIVYCVLDPFKVIKEHDTFQDKNSTGYVAINRDFVSTTTFTKNYLSANYNAFILGNSRSAFYQVEDWKVYLPDSSNCFHFDASGESLYALYKKLVYIDRHNVPIKHALIVLDHEILAQYKSKQGYLYTISPQLVNNSNWLNFHFQHFKAFLNPKFLYAYLDYTFSGKVKPYMKANFLLDDNLVSYDERTNEVKFENNEMLLTDNRYYTAERISQFYTRDTALQQAPAILEKKQKQLLNEMLTILNKHKTDYKILISPLFDQVKLHPNDLDFLKQNFGQQHVFDFSGKNEFTQDYQNYYEPSHYRPHVAREILKIAYSRTLPLKAMAAEQQKSN